MNNNEDIFIDSFILESQSYTDEQLKESLDMLTESSKQRLIEKVQSSDTEAKLSLENKNKLMSYLNDFINSLTTVVEETRERNKYSEQLKTIKGMIETAESIKERLDSNIIRNELKEPLKLKKSDPTGEERK